MTLKREEELDRAPKWVAAVASIALGATAFLVLSKKGKAIWPVLFSTIGNGVRTLALSKLVASPLFQYSCREMTGRNGVHRREIARSSESQARQ